MPEAPEADLGTTERNGGSCTLCAALSAHPQAGDKVTSQGSPRAFRRSASSGCPGCTLVVSALDAIKRWGWMPFDPDRRHKWNVWCRAKEPYTRQDGGVGIAASREGRRRFWHFRFEFYDAMAPGHKWPWPSRLREADLALPTNTGNEMAVAKIREWISTCETTHQCFGPRDPPPALPTRVVDVSNGGVRVVETSGMKARYMCLSHRWAAHEKFELTKANLERRMMEIEWNSLPKTYQDAIVLTRRLGVDYLWIDSLCIIQDDTLDWQRESATMARIYSGSYLTVGADLSVDKTLNWDCNASTDGCFSNIPPQRVGSIIHLQHPVNLNSQYAVGIRIPPARHKLGGLATRGWVMQEYRLSPRFVWFQNAEIIFNCNGDLFLGSLGATDYLPNLTEPFGPKIPTEKFYNDYGWSWRLVLERYTELNFTYSRDRLPALSGVAQAFQRYQKAQGVEIGQYLAGLWKGNLVEGLHWVRAHRDSAAERPVAYSAPSWSWASIGGACTSAVWTAKREDIRDHIKVISADCTPAGVDPYGQVTGGLLVLAGRLIPATLKQLIFGDAKQRFYATDIQIRHTGYHKFIGDVTVDIYLGHPLDIEEFGIALLPLTSFNINEDDHRDNGGYKGLALRQTDVKYDSNLAYERIGFFTNNLERGWLRVEGEDTEEGDDAEKTLREDGYSRRAWYNKIDESTIAII